MHAQWDTGYILTTIICGTIMVASAITGIASLIIWIKSRDRYMSLSMPVGIGADVILVVTALIYVLITFPPFSSQYHRFVPESGIVSKTGSRFLSSDVSGGGSTQKYVITYTNGQTFGCLDTRCANVRPGDRLTLLCERVFQWNAPVEGWDCNWGIDRQKNGEVIP